MSLFDNPDSILLLKKLLQPDEKGNSSSDSEDENQKSNHQFGPSQIGPKPKSKQSNEGPYKRSELEPVAELKKDMTIDTWMEEQEKQDDDVLETRKRPEYRISYKQNVGTEDVFLQMGNKTSASSSCEDMVIEVKLPQETVDVNQMAISVTEKEIDLSTPMYRLKLPLMHPINPDRSSAKYFHETRTLCLTCRMNREYDFVNF